MKYLAGAVLVVGIILGAVLYWRVPLPTPVKAPVPFASVSYACNGGKTIMAAYFSGESKPAKDPSMPPTPGGSIALTLSDGRTMTLAQTLSADGIRYANADESFIFWGKGNGALVLEQNEEKSYIGCIAVAPELPGQNLPRIYTNSGAGFSLRLPAGYSADESYRYQELGPKKTIHGISFTIPDTLAKGSNLSSDTFVSVEEIPKATTCSAALFLDRASATTLTDASTTYSVASSTGAAAGNRYEETVYALPGTNPCVAMRYFIHYGVIENYPPGAVREFDHAGLVATFDAIRRSLILVQ